MSFLIPRLTPILKRFLAPFSDSGGTALLETIVAITILSGLGTAVLLGVRTAHTSGDIVEGHSIAESLARNQMEYVFSNSYVSPPGSYVSIADATDVSFAVEPGFGVTAQALVYTEGDPNIVTDANIEKVVVTVTRNGKSVLTLETLRVKE